MLADRHRIPQNLVEPSKKWSGNSVMATHMSKEPVSVEQTSSVAVGKKASVHISREAPVVASLKTPLLSHPLGTTEPQYRPY